MLINVKGYHKCSQNPLFYGMKSHNTLAIFASAIALILIQPSLSLAQNNLSNKIIETMRKVTEEFPQEKIYLHLDRPYYASGDVIWMKAYHVAGSFHQPSPMSKTIHVELIDKNKEILQSILLRSDSGFVAGSISLPDSLKSGTYLIRAYTPWMRNFPDAYYFQREISILNTAGGASEKINEDIDLQFFPESGNLLCDVKGKIGFKAIGSDGLSRKIKFKIFNDSDSLIAEIESNQLGMGAFHLIPRNGRKYYALLNSPVNKKVALPATKLSGFLISVTQSPEKPNLTLKLQSTKSTPDKQDALIVSHSRGIINYVAKVDLSHNLAFVQIPKTVLLSGVSTLTLFSSSGQPVAERLVFIDQQDNLIVEASLNKKDYATREKATLQVKVTDKDGNPVSTNLSLAITDNQQVILDPDNQNIKNYFLLASDLTGYIESPGYYFNPSNSDRMEALDYLLLTQGWRRFNWENILQDKWPDILFPIDKGLTLSGKLKDSFTKKPLQDGKLTYMISGSAPDLQVAKTGPAGEFNFDDLIYYDSVNITLQGETKKGHKTVLAELNEQTTPPVGYSPKHYVNNLQGYEQSIIKKIMERKNIDAQFDKDAIMLDAVDVKAKKIDDAQIAKMYGTGSATVVASEVPGSQTAMHPLQLLQGRVAGVQVTGNGVSYSVTIRGVGSITGGTTPLIMVDNIPMDINSLSSIPAQNIESIEVFKGPEASIFGSAGANGVILFYTKKGGGWTLPTQGIFNYARQGYQSAKEFYSPKYDVVKPEHEKPDIRPTVFWCPVIKTNKLGQASVEFYTNDSESTMTGILEGISVFGKIAQGTFQYEISKKNKK